MTKQHILHLLPNAHLDPVWLWDWREGLNEGIVTARTILDLMDDFPELTFMRGEAAIYEHIEQNDPATFARILRQVDAGRWDVVGGTYIQPDSNLPSAETLCRQFERGLAYFETRFGKRPTAAWQADSFGHTPGWPNILQAFGMDSFTFTRPQRGEFPMASPVFHWLAGSGDPLLCYRQHWLWYCSERFNLVEKLDLTLREAAGFPFTHVGLLMGLGNHGGGPSRRHIEEVQAWATRHPECEVRFSTLHGFHAALRAELVPGSATGNMVPTVRGDLAFNLRGCYSSVAKFKFPYRRAEALLAGAEATQAVIAQALGLPPLALDEAWDAILFNSFHDILPGSSIERAFDDQLAWVGVATHRALVARTRALNALAREVDTTVPPPEAPDRPRDVSLLVWNPLPRPVRGWFELETNMDYRPAHGVPFTVGSLPLFLEGADGSKPVFQEVAVEHLSNQDAAWRKRMAVYDELPPLGWKMYRYGVRQQAADASPPGRVEGEICTASAGPQPTISGAGWKIAVAENAVKIWRGARNFFADGGAMHVELAADPWGSWGGMKEEIDSFCLENVLETWRITRTQILESGPSRAALWVRWEGSRSWLELTFHAAAGTPGIRVHGRLLMNERSARVRLVLPCTGSLTMEAPAARVQRNARGLLPAGRWAARGEGESRVGFVSDVLGDLDTTPQTLRVSLARATRYAADVNVGADDLPWLPAVDSGELRFVFCLAGDGADLPRMAAELLHPPVSLLVPPHPGTLGRSGSLGGLSPASVQLLAAQTDGREGLRLRVQNCSDHPAEVVWQVRGEPPSRSLGTLRPWEIANLSV